VACRERTRRQQGVFQAITQSSLDALFVISHVSETRKFAQLAYLMYNVCNVLRACRPEGSAKGTRNSKVALGYAHSQVRTQHASHAGALIVHELFGFIGFRLQHDESLPHTHTARVRAILIGTPTERLSQHSFISHELQHLRPSRCVTLEFRVKFMKLINLIINVNIHVEYISFDQV
jgi:hypothetical protein